MDTYTHGHLHTWTPTHVQINQYHLPKTPPTKNTAYLGKSKVTNLEQRFVTIAAIMI